MNRSGFYAWLKNPKSDREQKDNRLITLIQQFWLASGCVYGYRKIYHDLKESREKVGIKKVHRLMKQAKIRSKRGYKNHKTFKSGLQSTVTPNTLDR
ncbi:MAG: transposase [Endozoicomonadaceae bacterium]|nr:transposase [Endozoicomonadaceae bacterium]